MSYKKKQFLNDGLEFIIIFAAIFMLLSIYIPLGIWAEEDAITKKSQFRMQTVFEIEDFYHQLVGEFSEDPLWAMKVVNAVRDSLTADSTYLDQQTLILENRQIPITIPNSFDVVYDTTFGFIGERKDTIRYTRYTVVTFSPTRNVNDTLYVTKKDLPELQENPNFVGIASEDPAQRVEAITYYDSYRPDSSYFFCPISKDPFEINIEDGLKVASPIEEEIKERRFLIFSFKARNHGYIEDGVPSWES